MEIRLLEVFIGFALLALAAGLYMSRNPRALDDTEAERAQRDHADRLTRFGLAIDPTLLRPRSIREETRNGVVYGFLLGLFFLGFVFFGGIEGYRFPRDFIPCALFVALFTGAVTLINRSVSQARARGFDPAAGVSFVSPSVGPVFLSFRNLFFQRGLRDSKGYSIQYQPGIHALVLVDVEQARRYANRRTGSPGSSDFSPDPIVIDLPPEVSKETGVALVETLQEVMPAGGSAAAGGLSVTVTRPGSAEGGAGDAAGAEQADRGPIKYVPWIFAILGWPALVGGVYLLFTGDHDMFVLGIFLVLWGLIGGGIGTVGVRAMSKDRRKAEAASGGMLRFIPWFFAIIGPAFVAGGVYLMAGVEDKDWFPFGMFGVMFGLIAGVLGINFLRLSRGR
jgi:hypothetical protein